VFEKCPYKSAYLYKFSRFLDFSFAFRIADHKVKSIIAEPVHGVTQLTLVFTHAYVRSGSFAEKRPNKSTNQELKDTLEYANRVPLSFWRNLGFGARG
jgi:hypothetical protein